MKFSELINRLPDVLRSSGNCVVRRVSDDSRRVEPGDVFIARAGAKVRGAAFVTDALARGAVAIISEELLDVPAGIAFAQVENANRAAGMIAHALLGDPTRGMTILGVTGTKGKTTVAYLLRSILNGAGKKCGLIGTVQIDDGANAIVAEMTTPGAIELAELFARMKANGCTHAVMEVSSHALHQHRTAGIDFAVGMFTNLTGDHLDYHGTMDAYGDAKAMLFDDLRSDATAVVNADDAYGARMLRGCRAKAVTYRVVGEKPRGSEGSAWIGYAPHMTIAGTALEFYGPAPMQGPDNGARNLFFNSPLVGKHNIYNSLCAATAARAIGISNEHIVSGLQAMRGVPGRLQNVVTDVSGRGADQFQVFVDYAHTHDALQNVLTALRATMAAEGKLICVFGCGGDRDRTKRPKMAKVAETLADRVVLTSDNPRTEDPAAIIDEVASGFSSGWQAKGTIAIEADRRVAIRKAISLAGPRDVVLIAGKGHEDYQIIGTTKHHFDDVEEAAAAMEIEC